MNFAADPLYVSQRDEAALLGIFHVRVEGTTVRWVPGPGYTSRKVSLLRRSDLQPLARPRLLGPGRQGCCAGWTSPPGTAEGTACFQMSQQKLHVWGISYLIPWIPCLKRKHLLRRNVTDFVWSSDRSDWIGISTLWYLISERERLEIILPGTYMFLN